MTSTNSQGNFPGSEGTRGFTPPSIRPNYQTYRSPYAPDYKVQPNFHGINARRLWRFTKSSALFGGVAGIFAIFFFSDVPRVRIDIMQKFPIIGDYFIKEVPPEDDPF